MGCFNYQLLIAAFTVNSSFAKCDGDSFYSIVSVGIMTQRLKHIVKFLGLELSLYVALAVVLLVF